MATRSGVPSRSRSATVGASTIQEFLNSRRGRAVLDRQAGRHRECRAQTGVPRAQTRSSLITPVARTSAREPNHVANAIAVEVGRRFHELRNRREFEPVPQAGRPVSSAIQGMPGCPVSQTGSPVCPSRRMTLLPVHSIKSALPGLSSSAAVAAHTESALARVPAGRRTAGPALGPRAALRPGKAHAPCVSPALTAKR